MQCFAARQRTRQVNQTEELHDGNSTARAPLALHARYGHNLRPAVQLAVGGGEAQLGPRNVELDCHEGAVSGHPGTHGPRWHAQAQVKRCAITRRDRPMWSNRGEHPLSICTRCRLLLYKCLLILMSPKGRKQ